MLKDAAVVAMVAVSDIAASKVFYGDTLGLTQTDENMGGVTYSNGNGRLFMYQAPTAGKNQATSATWEVHDISAVTKDLKAKGVSFEHYEFPGVEYDGDVHVMGDMKAAWFKDLDGNILGLGEVHN